MASSNSTANDIPVRIYYPESYHLGKPALLVFFHGGGWVIGSCDTHHNALSCVAQLTQCAVASVDYRLAPEHKFPAAVEDVIACTEWFLSPDNRESVGLPREIVIGVGGDSAGGNMAAVVTHELKARKSISFQVSL